MVASHPVAKRYALSLFELSIEESLSSVISENFSDLMNALEKDETLHRAFHAPIFSESTQKQLITFMGEKSKWHKRFQAFLHILCANRRLSLIDAVFSCYCALVERHESRAVAQITAATKLTAKDKKTIESTIGKRIGVRKVQLEEKTDPTLLGGFVVEVANLRIDTSLRGELTRLRQHLETVNLGS